MHLKAQLLEMALQVFAVFMCARAGFQSVDAKMFVIEDEGDASVLMVHVVMGRSHLSRHPSDHICVHISKIKSTKWRVS